MKHTQRARLILNSINGYSHGVTSMKRFFAFTVSYLIFGVAAFGSMKVGIYVSEIFFGGSTFPMVMICGAGCCAGYLIAITFMKGAGFKNDVE